MKKQPRGKRSGQGHLILVTMAVAGFGLGLSLVSAQESNDTAALPVLRSVDEPGSYRNWLTVGMGYNALSGDRAQFMYQERAPSGAYGGLEAIHLEQDVGENGTMTVDGRALFDHHDYLFKLKLDQPDLGYVEAGFQKFRTWYDGSGGYSSRSNAWLNLYDDELFLDRGEGWVEAALVRPDWPVLRARYTHQFRTGKKDSTVWGDYNLNAGATGTVLRNIVPTFLEIDETRHIVEGDLTHTWGNTEVGAGVRYEGSDLNNSRNIYRRPGEPATERAVTQTDEVETDLFNVHGSTRSQLHDKVLFTTGYAFTRMDTDIGGSRIYGADYGVPYDPAFVNNPGYLGLGGGSRADQYVATFNLMYTPWATVAIVPSFRIEHLDQDGFARFTRTEVVGGVPAEIAALNAQDRDFTDVSESIEVRYSGITNWALYVQAHWLRGWGGLSEDQQQPGMMPSLQRETDSERLVQKYTAGATWYAHRRVTLGGQYYFKARKNDYDHTTDTTIFVPPTTGNLYPAFITRHQFDTHDLNARITWRPIVRLTLVSRYDFQISTTETKADQNNTGAALSQIESSELVAHIFSQSASWTPTARLYMQGSFTYALDETQTPASRAGGAAAGVVQDSENDYWTGSALVGYAVTERADVQGQYFYYRADNYVDNSLVSLPYGAGAEQQGVTVTWLHRLRSNVLWKLQYGFFTGHDQTSGGNNDYTAHLAYSSFQYLF